MHSFPPPCGIYDISHIVIRGGGDIAYVHAASVQNNISHCSRILHLYY